VVVASPTIRPATPADAGAIRGLVNGARLNPRDLDWRRFLVAEDGGAVVACAQVRVHAGGSRELASVAVAPARQGEGIGRLVSEAAIAREPVRPLYLYTESRTESFWARFAFATIDGGEIPADMRGALRFARVATRIYGLLTRRRIWIVVMRRDDP
jgi:N-acetylglutamate synthase-like GNAT family acetyltransferase